MLLLSSAIAFALHILPVHSFSVLCALDIYGKPQVDDSYEIVTKLPFLSDDPYHDLTKHRVFAEPAYLQPRFSQLVNPFESSMVQLPKIWRTRSARMALLSYADASGQVPRPMTVTDWKNVKTSADGVLQYCTYGQGGSGGVYSINDMHGIPYMALYIYAVGSPFEEIVNKYMITGRGINPYHPRSGTGNDIEGIAYNITKSTAVDPVAPYDQTATVAATAQTIPLSGMPIASGQQMYQGQVPGGVGTS